MQGMICAQFCKCTCVRYSQAIDWHVSVEAVFKLEVSKQESNFFFFSRFEIILAYKIGTITD